MLLLYIDICTLLYHSIIYCVSCVIVRTGLKITGPRDDSSIVSEQSPGVPAPEERILWSQTRQPLEMQSFLMIDRFLYIIDRKKNKITIFLTDPSFIFCFAAYPCWLFWFDLPGVLQTPIFSDDARVRKKPFRRAPCTGGF